MAACDVETVPCVSGQCRTYEILTCTALLTRLSKANIQWGLMLCDLSVEFTAS